MADLDAGDPGLDVTAEPGLEPGGELDAGTDEERPDYLLEDYEDAESQARAYHGLANQYQGRKIDELARNGAYIADLYQRNPQVRAMLDAVAQGRAYQPEQPQQQQQARPMWYDPQDEAARDQFWHNAVNQPEQVWPQIIQHYTGQALAPIGQQIQSLAQTLANLQYQMIESKHGDLLKKMPGALMAQVQRGAISVDQAVQLMQEMAPKPAQQASQQTSPTSNLRRFGSSGGRTKSGAAASKNKANSFADVRKRVERELRASG